MAEERIDRSQPDSAEGEQASSASEAVPEELSGEGATPLGSSDEHSDAPGPHGLGPLNPDAPEPDDDPRIAPLEPAPSEADADD
jgi:hypothetical protein